MPADDDDTFDAFQRTLAGLYAKQARVLPAGTRWFDSHTHTGANDPDGFKATDADILAALDTAGHERALVFSSMDPAGYRAANDRVLGEASASGGRLVALARWTRTTTR